MQDEGSGTGTTTYLVEFRQERGADLLVDVPGPPCDESRAEAVRRAEARRGTGEAMAWGSVGGPYVVSAAPVDGPRGIGAVA
jgi:hypothetical protein